MQCPPPAQSTELTSRWVGTQTSRLHTFLRPSSFSIPLSHFFLRGRKATRGVQSQPVEADQETPFLSWARPSSSMSRASRTSLSGSSWRCDQELPEHHRHSFHCCARDILG